MEISSEEITAARLVEEFGICLCQARSTACTDRKYCQDKAPFHCIERQNSRTPGRWADLQMRNCGVQPALRAVIFRSIFHTFCSPAHWPKAGPSAQSGIPASPAD